MSVINKKCTVFQGFWYHLYPKLVLDHRADGCLSQQF